MPDVHIMVRVRSAKKVGDRWQFAGIGFEKDHPTEIKDYVVEEYAPGVSLGPIAGEALLALGHHRKDGVFVAVPICLYEKDWLLLQFRKAGVKV